MLIPSSGKRMSSPSPSNVTAEPSSSWYTNRPSAALRRNKPPFSGRRPRPCPPTAPPPSRFLLRLRVRADASHSCLALRRRRLDVRERDAERRAHERVGVARRELGGPVARVGAERLPRPARDTELDRDARPVDADQVV